MPQMFPALKRRAIFSCPFGTNLSLYTISGTALALRGSKQAAEMCSDWTSETPVPTSAQRAAAFCTADRNS